MATVNNVTYSVAAETTATFFNVIWRQTRAMKKAGWKYMGSSNGSTKNTSKDPAADLWGSGAVTNAGASAASIAAPTRGRATVTGLTGISAADKGRFLVISGGATSANNNHHQIEEVLSSTSVRIDARTFAVASDASNGALSWSIRDPLTEAYPTAIGTNTGWWCAMGPSILKIPVTTAPGVFTIGENVVQTTTGAEGEILGYVYDPVSTSGYLTVAPRLRGTGSGVWGWDTGNLVTGGLSGATATQNGTALDYRFEVVFFKPAGSVLGQIYLGNFESVGDSAEAFSTIMTSAGATASTAPGQGGTGNTFPAHGWVQLGTGVTNATSVNWNSVSTTSSIPVYNCIGIAYDSLPEQGYSADGSWVLGLGNLVTSGGSFVGYYFMKLEDSEDGDLAPYVSFAPANSSTLYTNSRLSFGSAVSSDTGDSFTTARFVSNSSTYFKGWRRRGLVGELFTDLEIATLQGRQSLLALMSANISFPLKVATAATLMVKVREPIWLTSFQASSKVVKGSLKYLFVVQGGTILDLYENRWLQMSNTLAPFVLDWGSTQVWLTS